MKGLSGFKIKYNLWRNELKEHWFSIFISFILIIIAVSINYAAGYYVSYKAQVVNVTDLILDHFGPYNLNFLYVYGWLFTLFIYIAYPLFYKVKKFHVAIIQFSFLGILRSVFIILTHLQTPIDAVGGKFPLLLMPLRFTNDQFFSGHVSLAFLGFLMFYENKKLRWFFLISSIIIAITVLAMHQHYSIDVFAAFFMAYCSFKIGNWLISKLKL